LTKYGKICIVLWLKVHSAVLRYEHTHTHTHTVVMHTIILGVRGGGKGTHNPSLLFSM